MRDYVVGMHVVQTGKVGRLRLCEGELLMPHLLFLFEMI